MLVPDRHKCLELLELERLQVNPQSGTGRYNIANDAERKLVADYNSVVGWFEGFFTAVNTFDQPDGNVTKETKPHQWITWTFSYCREHPSANLANAAFELLKAFRRDSTTGR